MFTTWNPMTDSNRSRTAMPICGRASSTGYRFATTQGHVSLLGGVFTREAGFKAAGPDAWSPPTL